MLAVVVVVAAAVAIVAVLALLLLLLLLVEEVAVTVVAIVVVAAVLGRHVVAPTTFGPALYTVIHKRYREHGRKRTHIPPVYFTIYEQHYLPGIFFVED